MAKSSQVAIALGSNLGDRHAHLAFAVDQLRRNLDDLRVSSTIETEPVDVPDIQPPYLNAVAIGRTTLTPAALLAVLMQIEQSRGRRRPTARAPRTLDLDLILFDDRIIQTTALTVPHPRFRERRFVLAPLAELEPEWKDPVSGATAAELLRRLSQSEP